MATKKASASAAKQEPVVADEKTVVNTTSKARKIDPDDYVSVRNNTMGTLIYISSRQMGYNVTWEEFGDEEMIKYGELQAMRNSQKRFFTDNWIYIDDPEVVRALGVEKYYKHAVDPDSLRDLFELPVGQLRDRIAKMSDGMKDCIKRMAIHMYDAGELDSVSKMRVLEETLDFKFDLE